MSHPTAGAAPHTLRECKRRRVREPAQPQFLRRLPRPPERDGKAARAAGRQRKPPYEGGRSAEWMAAERASRAAAGHGADARVGGPMEAGADDNQRIMTSDSFLPIKPVIMQLSADPDLFPFTHT
jgi:hypothetical protein